MIAFGLSQNTVNYYLWFDMGKTIGIFGGTFDPIHFGHLNLAIEVLEKKPLDEVWFCPAHISPFKQGEKSVEPSHRLNMINLALTTFKQFRSIDIELKREGPSYTIDTLRYLIDQEKLNLSPKNFVFIMGDDATRDFLKWHLAEEIVRLVPLAIGCRQQHLQCPLTGNQNVDKALKQGCIPTRVMDISATEIRDRLKKGLNCRHLVPKEVLDYIKEFHLY